ncbi:MAG: ATP-binding protein [bacterium]
MRFEKRIANNLAEATMARTWLRECLDALSTEDSDLIPDISLVFGELVTNSVRHAYGEKLCGPIDIALSLSDEWLELSIRDYGRSMDPATYTRPDLTKPNEGGYGIHLVKKLTDEFRIEVPGGEGNRFVVRRRLAGRVQRTAERSESA